eukprot:1140742-Rhodomonas_salina.1
MIERLRHRHLLSTWSYRVLRLSCQARPGPGRIRKLATTQSSELLLDLWQAGSSSQVSLVSASAVVPRTMQPRQPGTGPGVLPAVYYY